jgi:hypothetical protein
MGTVAAALKCRQSLLGFGLVYRLEFGSGLTVSCTGKDDHEGVQRVWVQKERLFQAEIEEVLAGSTVLAGPPIPHNGHFLPNPFSVP